jgi:hypothetical protein
VIQAILVHIVERPGRVGKPLVGQVTGCTRRGA